MTEGWEFRMDCLVGALDELERAAELTEEIDVYEAVMNAERFIRDYCRSMGLLDRVHIDDDGKEFTPE